MDLLNCNWDTSKFLIFSENVYDPLIYYSHLLPLVSSLFLGFFVFFTNKKSKINILFFLLTICFSIWVYFDLILWATEKNELSMFFWSSLVYFEFALFTVGFFLLYSFLYKEKKAKIFPTLFSLFFIPILIFANTEYNLISFDLTNCDRGLFEGPLWSYIYLFEILVIGLSSLISIVYFINNKKEGLKKLRQELIFSIGTVVFMLIFLAGNITLIAEMAWNYEQYKLFGMVFFLLVLLFLIVRFKTFNLKLVGAQALVWALIILVGAQFLYLNEMPTSSLILTAATLAISTMIGLLVVRSVKKVDHQRELLDIANKNQQSLLHFITHQVKGYLTKSRNIFDGMVAGDYDPISDKAREMAKYGFDSDTRGVETVMAILRASDLKTGKTAFKKEKANVSALVAEAVEARKDIATSKGLDFSFEIEPNIEIQVDPIHIKEVFKNLLTNAILYTQKGTVHTVLKREHGKVKFSVVDTGVGLSPQDKMKLFTEGGKGEEASSVNVDSTGYGLYIAKQIVGQHGGTISAHSEGRGKGSEFSVLLPDVG